MASLTWWTWVWANSRSLRWTGRPGMQQFMGLQWVRHDWVTELNWTELNLDYTESESESISCSVLSLCDPKDCSPSGSSVHGILQARILEWVAIPFSRGSSWLRDQTLISRIIGRFFTVWATREAWWIILGGQ